MNAQKYPICQAPDYQSKERARMSVGKKSMPGIDRDEFMYHLDHLNECMHRMEGEVAALKATVQLHGPKLLQIETELRSTEKELGDLQGQGIAHGVRLDGIDRALVSLKDEIVAFHKTLKEEIGANRGVLANHTTQEEAWQRKILFTGVTMLLGILATFISGFILKFTH